MIRLFCVVILFTSTVCLVAQTSIQKAIYSGNYEKAKEAIDKALQKEPEDILLNFAIAQFHTYKDNPHHQLPVAWQYIHTTETLFQKIKDTKQIQKLAQQGVRPATINQLKIQIENLGYAEADSINTVRSWEYFLSKFPKTSKENIAIEKRNDLAYKQAQSTFSYESFKSFMEQYPNAAQVPEAKKLYESLLYKNVTAPQTWQSYKEFIDKYPQSPYYDEALAQYESLLFQEFNQLHQVQAYQNFVLQFSANRYVPQAEDSIYKLFINEGNIDNYEQFIQQFPKNKNVKAAWLHLYHLYTTDFSINQIDSFAALYVSFPFKEQLVKDKQLSSLVLKPFEDNGKYGFINANNGEIVIPALYEEASEFIGRYAVVKTLNCVSLCYNYIDREGKLLLTTAFDEANDFANGFAVVGKGNCETGDCVYGLINQSGKIIAPLVYEEVFDVTANERALVKKNGLYGFINMNGSIVISNEFLDAYSFSENLAAVKKDSLWGFINTKGEIVIKPQFTNAGNFSYQLAPVANEQEIWGFINTVGLWVLPAKYHFANSFEQEKAIVLLKEKNKKGIEIINEKTIDLNGNIIEPAKPKTPVNNKGKKKK